MQTFADHAAVLRGIRMFDYSTLPQEMRDKAEGLADSPSIVDKVVNLAEFLYSKRGDANLPASARELTASLTAYATMNGWYGLINDARGDRIVQAMRRDLGEDAPSGTSWPAEADDPAPLSQFAPPPAGPAPAPSSNVG